MARPEVITLTNGMFAQNCYVLADRERGEAALIDPGEESGVFLARLAHERLKLTAIWLTHAHLDHMLGVHAVKEASGAPIWLHPADRPLYDRAPAQAAMMLGMELPQPPVPDHEFVPGTSVSLGDLSFEVRHVPGHSPGSVAFVGHGIALVGDALFQGSIGRVDLPGGDGATLLASIRNQLLTLPDETIVYSGHGPETTIGAERLTNPFLTGAVRLA